MKQSINLLDINRWDHALPWGNIINPDTKNEICINEKLVTYPSGGSMRFGCSNATCKGWKRDKNWNIVETTTQWSVGAVVAHDACRTHFGTYHFVFRLPDFRGSWPAIWLLDLHPKPPHGDGMGMPPEIDIFEQFRKDAISSRFHMEHTFHQGPTYQNNKLVSKTYWKLLPLDLSDIDLTFTWLPSGMTWIVNGKVILTVPSGTPNYPMRPMNLLMNAGLGLDWKPNVGKFEDLVVKKAEYLAM
ncbi:MAG: glycoside hydrolase family 16 protein [Bacteroidales bacterium]